MRRLTRGRYKQEQFKIPPLKFRDFVADAELDAWTAKQAGRWVWCARCRVARSPEAHRAHKVIHRDAEPFVKVLEP